MDHAEQEFLKLGLKEAIGMHRSYGGIAPVYCFRNKKNSEPVNWKLPALQRRSSPKFVYLPLDTLITIPPHRLDEGWALSFHKRAVVWKS